MINGITSVSICSCSSSKIDEEHKRIIEKLYRVYGIRSTGNKASDKAILREKEVLEAEKLDFPQGNFLALSPFEEKKIIEKNKKKKVEETPDIYQNSNLGQQILAEQMMIYMQMNSNNI